jgi:arylsulfatase A-like enzyme
MFSGKHVAEEAMKPPAEVAWLPEVFRNAGFATAGFVSNELMTAKEGFGRGFDAFTQPLPEHGSNAPILEWVRAHAGQKTFTLVHLIEPHDPYDPPADLRRWTDEKGALGPERLRWFEEVSKQEGLVEHDASVAEIEKRIGQYDDEVRAGDRRIGEILEMYKAAGMWADTAVIVAADHGEGLFTHVQLPIGTRKKAMDAREPPTLLNTLLMTHGSHVDIELLHVPLIIKAPGLKPASVTGWVENVDVLPTVLELAGVAIPKSVQGQSLVPIAEHPSDKSRLRECVVSYSRYYTSVIDQDSMQVILPSPRGECDFGLTPRVYDLAHDPECRSDLASSRRELVKRAEACSASVSSQAIREQSGPVDSAQMRALQGMGYVGDVVDHVRQELAEASVEALLKTIAEPGDCFRRLEAARALEVRKLEVDERAKVREILKREISPAIRAELERVLSK